MGNGTQGGILYDYFLKGANGTVVTVTCSGCCSGSGANVLLVKHPGFAIKMSKLVDGTSKTFLVGEKHVQDDKFGTQIGLVGNTWDGRRITVSTTGTM